MKKLSIVTALVFIFSCANADNSIAVENLSLKIKTVDENNNAFKVETVRWWRPELQNQLFELQCNSNRCANWEIKENISGTIIIRAYTSIVTKNDENCWDLYGGEAVVTMPTQDVTIVMKFENTACS